MVSLFLYEMFFVVIARYEAIANFAVCDCFVPRNDNLRRKG